ncbi:DEAD/DEAH box helicase [Bradyrhizobium sp. CCGUVB1N3]|uniref:DEAD/DEAH box helicase n=1 Tax=Bradyrhizobium sp. CCGUVB1N3 TaxID=2949629 RepID=UPI00353246B2
MSLLLVLKNEAKENCKPCLLVAPASLLANWAAEIGRFAPSLKTVVVHPSAAPSEKLNAYSADEFADVDLVITSYGFLTRTPWLEATPWQFVVLDEAQAIKNQAAKQTKSVKRLKAEMRIALTGTPIENRLGDLWSIFDFINPGLLGSSKDFSAFVKRLADRPHNSYGPLRDLVRPYILRRLKTDKSIIADLPDKTEVKTFCPLSRKQAALYQQAVAELASHLEEVDGIKRKGIVLAFLMRLKQICNHPSQWLGDGRWSEHDSGKLGVCATSRKWLLLGRKRHLSSPNSGRQRRRLRRSSGPYWEGPALSCMAGRRVRQFQEDENVPFFVLSVKAGGTGLNLTAASHVIHFDRWWNPAVENSALQTRIAQAPPESADNEPANRAAVALLHLPSKARHGHRRKRRRTTVSPTRRA